MPCYSSLPWATSADLVLSWPCGGTSPICRGNGVGARWVADDFHGEGTVQLSTIHLHGARLCAWAPQAASTGRRLRRPLVCDVARLMSNEGTASVRRLLSIPLLGSGRRSLSPAHDTAYWSVRPRRARTAHGGGGERPRDVFAAARRIVPRRCRVIQKEATRIVTHPTTPALYCTVLPLLRNGPCIHSPNV
ncbi:hypothetical protein CC85DRAFT_33139 [Cutaneotrichosporon oleaginosum]|uniref:Uncharacterized protein n=1 Tax=Cutaneotrichosporon oleaginosum TaxID=879819 RepID=A0A0J0XBK5_9TREE|nr:uncharacterized protein CC85DRAFT_33139 [Cutaneotrichosporon oleaginosum]KLT38442.1 hypothetical protein CC85DRAFT_33139 [Cutaneotrichosporon oleaginosum]TXT08291.1 hypothetical protein COLE_05215 [Cutaneotrichosporon oleaginosum]